MKAVILCGGLGTRLRDPRSLTGGGAAAELPKPMLPIGDRPVLWHIMKCYAAHGIRDFVLCLGYRGWMIKDFFLNYHLMTSNLVLKMGVPPQLTIEGGPHNDEMTVTLAETGESTMTSGRIAAIRRYVENDQEFCLTYGDGLSNVNIRELIAFHRSQGKVATVTAVAAPGRFGELRLAGDRVEVFAEKPSQSASRINGGFFVVDSKRIWDFVGDDPQMSFEREPLERLANAGQLGAFRHDGFWQAMDTVREYMALNDLWASGDPPWKCW